MAQSRSGTSDGRDRAIRFRAGTGLSAHGAWEALALTTWLTLAAIASVSSYLQTVTGFAFALVFMSAVAISNLIPIEDGATIVSILMLVNAATLLAKEWRYVARSPFLQIVPISLVATVIGMMLLPVFLAKSVIWLKFVLGVVIIGSSLQLLWLRRDADHPRPAWAFPLSGVAAGLMGGLFAIPGPPVVYALQRYLPSHRQIRATLVAIFGAVTAVRLGMASVLAVPAGHILATTAMLVPVTIATTVLAHRRPPPLSPDMLRRITICLLVLTGVVLVLPALSQMAGPAAG